MNASVTAGWLGAVRLSRRALLIAVCAAMAAVLAVGAEPRLGGGSATVAGTTQPAHPNQLWMLPAAAQGPVSAALGRAEWQFWVGDGQADGANRAGATGGGADPRIARNPAQHLLASFSPGGVSVATPGRGAISLTVAGATGAPRIHANVVRYHGHDLSYAYANGPLGLEQTFTVPRRPVSARATARGSLTIQVAVNGATATVHGQTVTLTGSGGTTLRYGRLSAVDARGHTLPSHMRVQGGRILLQVDDRGAAYPIRIDPLVEQGGKLTGSGAGFGFGMSVALSADGNTALIGAPSYGSGATFVFTRSGGSWSQQGPALTTTDTAADFGWSVALSADGSTALIGAENDSSAEGAAWVYTRSGSTWTQQGSKLTAGGGAADEFGWSVALATDGNTAIIGGPDADVDVGAAWVFARSGSNWTQQGSELTPNDASGPANFGQSVALSADGTTALIGGIGDTSTTPNVPDENAGAAWVFTQSGGTWTQQGAKLTAETRIGFADFGQSVALSADGRTALIGSPQGATDAGGSAAVFVDDDGAWAEQAQLVADEEIGSNGFFGEGVALTPDGNTALIGSPDDNGVGAVWSFTCSGGTWTQNGAKVTAADSDPESGVGSSVALSANGATALAGGWDQDSSAGAAWVFTAPLISSPPAASFGDQTVTQTGPVQWIPVQNSGQANLTFTGTATITGANDADFTVPPGDDLCDGQTLAPGLTCWIGVQFTPSASGSESATLTIGANNTVSPAPASVALSGAGVPATAGPAGSQGQPGATGASGTDGQPGLTGSQGSAGATGGAGGTGAPGAPGKTGTSGKVELVTCKAVVKKVKHKRKTVQECTAKAVSSSVTFTTTRVTTAALDMGRHVYARGIVLPSKHEISVLITTTGKQQLRAGVYTLTRTHKRPLRITVR